jgi:hypothetical protein
MITPPRSLKPEAGSLFFWALRILGLTIVFVFTAAPLPGDTPGCGEPGGVDESPALIGDGPIRTMCGEHCYADCHRLVTCGRYVGDSGYSTCVAECTGATGRDCVALTFDGLCPIDTWGSDRVVTENEVQQCLDDAAAQGCWCEAAQVCFDPGVSSVPLSCTAGALCDPR